MADVPGVGQNFHDHINVYGLTWTVPFGVSPQNLGLLAGVDVFSPSSLQEFIRSRKGELTTRRKPDDLRKLKEKVLVMIELFFCNVFKKYVQ